MIILIGGSSYSGKTLLAQRLLERYHFPYLSIDHLKMGLIRTHMTDLTPLSSKEDLIHFLWPVAREIIRTAIENNQHLIVEGAYIPEDYLNDFDEEESSKIRILYIILSDDYIDSNFEMIVAKRSTIEMRKYDMELTAEDLKNENQERRRLCELYHVPYIIINHFSDFFQIK